MASKKDMRRDDLIIPYQETDSKKEEGGDMTSTMSSTLPMAAIFTRNKMIGWTSVMFAIQQYLSETPSQRTKAATPAYFSVGMSLLATAVGYMPLFMPPPAARGAASGTEAPAAVPI